MAGLSGILSPKDLKRSVREALEGKTIDEDLRLVAIAYNDLSEFDQDAIGNEALRISNGIKNLSPISALSLIYHLERWLGMKENRYPRNEQFILFEKQLGG